MGLNDKGVANNWVYSNGDTSRLVFLAHEKLNVKNYILVSQTGTWGSLSILSHIIVLMYRLTVVGSLEDVISSRTFSVCSKVCSKSSTFLSTANLVFILSFMQIYKQIQNRLTSALRINVARLL